MTEKVQAEAIEEMEQAHFTPAPSGGESPVSANVKLIGENGADIMLTVRAGATVEEVTNVLGVMAQSLIIARDKYKLTPAPARNSKAAASANGDAPVCQYHGPMKRSKHFKGWYCTSKMADGSYCKEKVMD